MDIIRLKDTVNPVLPASVATIGFFDGVHRGHQFLIRQVRQEAQASGLSAVGFLPGDEQEKIATLLNTIDIIAGNAIVLGNI